MVESRPIHQKQKPQQTVPAKVIQKERLFLFMVNHSVDEEKPARGGTPKKDFPPQMMVNWTLLSMMPAPMA